MLLSLAASQAAVIDLEAYRFDPRAGEPSIPPDLAVADGGAGGYGYYIVQTTGPVSDAWRTALESDGARLYGYVPESAFLVGLDAAARERVAARVDVAWIGPFRPAYRISPQVGTHAFVSPLRRSDNRLTLIVRVFRDLDATAARLAGLGCEVLDRTDDGFSQRLLVRAPRERVSAIARVQDVWWIEEQPEFLTMNNVTKWVAQSNVSGWTPLWDHGINGEGMIATIMDTGVDYNSCWFRENGNAQPGPSHRKVIHYATFGGGLAYDGCDTGHGSHVAGTMCGDQSYINPGNYNYNGMAYKAKFTVQDVGADDWSACNLGTLSVPSSLSSAFTASYGLGARVHQNSWGSTSNAYDSYSVDVDNAMWNHPDYLVCFAAGNSGPGSGTVGSPGTAKNCVTVGACRQAPEQNTMASYSSRGPATDSRYKPTVTAPGGESPTYITSVDNDPGNPPSPTCQTASDPFQGTSMATPCVSGMALNTQQYFSEGFYPDGAAGTGGFFPSAALVKAVIVSSTADMATADIPNNNEGWGRVLMDNALYFDGDTRELITEQVAPGLGTGEVWTREFVVDDATEPLVVTVVWTDYPGTSGASVTLVNDLDITLTAPGGTQYKGNVFSGGFSSTGGSNDRRNVEECVRLSSTPLGSYTLEVRGYNVPHGPQPFAVAINGGFGDWPPGGFSGAGPSAASARGAWVEASPNPSGGLTQLEYAVPDAYAGRVELDVLDASGRVVRQLVGKGQRGGVYRVTWDGLDEQRRAVAEGVYFARLRMGADTAGARLIVMH
jgi:hypothetical protein